MTTSFCKSKTRQDKVLKSHRNPQPHQSRPRRLPKTQHPRNRTLRPGAESVPYLWRGVAGDLLPAERGALAGTLRGDVAPGGSGRRGPVEARGLRGVGAPRGPRAVVAPCLRQAGVVRVWGAVGSVGVGRIHGLGTREEHREGYGTWTRAELLWERGLALPAAFNQGVPLLSADLPQF